MAILFLIGAGKEDPSIVTSLLDVKATPGKPLYELADPKPLVLYDCGFKPEDVQWRSTHHTTERNVTHFNDLWEDHAITASMENLFANVSKSFPDVDGLPIFTTPLSSSFYELRKVRNHTPLFKRPVCRK